jgi:hypothetical protein
MEEKVAFFGGAVYLMLSTRIQRADKTPFTARFCRRAKTRVSGAELSLQTT